ncbi:MAG: hypothetical protein LC793_00795 [Thermomicrobia bacterium]|nr:hypothetical protein [Thermomicrobia bacterium]
MVNKQDEVRITLVLDSEESVVADGTALAVGRFGGRVTSSVGDNMEILVPAQALLERFSGRLSGLFILVCYPAMDKEQEADNTLENRSRIWKADESGQLLRRYRRLAARQKYRAHTDYDARADTDADKRE